MKALKRISIAIQFLTILSLPGKKPVEPKELAKSMAYFPLAGLLIGVLLSLSLFILIPLPKLVTGVLILIISTIITGGIHLDGFIDTCDGFYGNNPKEKILEIMRDSRVGAMGAIGIVFILLLKLSLFVNIPQSVLWRALIIMVVFGRWSLSLAAYVSSYVRSEGKGKCFMEYAGKNEFFMGTFFTIALFLVFMGLKGVVLFIFSLVPVLLFINYAKRKIGGMTGDTIGAASEIAEVGVLLFTVCFY